MGFVDESSEIGRYSMAVPWGEVTVLPGDALQAHVPASHQLTIKNRLGPGEPACSSDARSSLRAESDHRGALPFR